MGAFDPLIRSGIITVELRLIIVVTYVSHIHGGNPLMCHNAVGMCLLYSY